MNKGARVATTLVLVAGFAGAVGWSMLGHRQEQGARAQQVALDSVEQMTGYVTVDVDPFFADARVQAILREHGLPVRATRLGSRDMPAKLAAGAHADFWFASGVLAANQIDDAARQAGQPLAQSAPFNSPLVVASWAPIAAILEANGVAHRTGDRVYGLDMAKLAELMLAKKRWNELKGAQAYDVKRSVLVSTTDVRKSNSAAMYLALLSQALQGEVVSDRAGAVAAGHRLAELFRRQGFQENYVNGNFDDYVQIGIGKAPLAFIYEYQIAGYAMSRKGVSQDMVLMYPEPTVVNKFVLLAATPRGKALQALLASDAGLQKIAVEYGFRGTDPDAFAAAIRPTGLAVQDRVRQVVDPPAFELMTLMIDTVTAEMAQ
jgi:hypothetical protein